MKDLIDFFYIGKNGSFVEEVTNELIFKEDDRRATQTHKSLGNLTIKNGTFIKLNPTFIESAKFTPKSTLQKKGDGIAFEQQSKTLLLVEIKTSLGEDTYRGLIHQLSASLVKILQNISLFQDINEINIQLFITGIMKEDTDEESTFAYKEGENEDEIISHSYLQLKRKGHFVFNIFPCFAFLGNKLHQSYKKQNVKIFYYKPDSTHIFQTP
jgi:hypothetical protein